MSDLDDIRDHLNYDPETGVFRWIRPTSRRTRVGAVAGCTSARRGYRCIRFRGKYYQAHRLAWLFVHGEMLAQDAEVDHRNGTAAGDGALNLRAATSSQNKCNSNMRSDNTSGYRGVSFYHQTGKWFAEVKFGKRRVWHGYFNTAEAAARARDTVALEHHGEFARLNFPARKVA